jgi:hypothetical protein
MRDDAPLPVALSMPAFLAPAFKFSFASSGYNLKKDRCGLPEADTVLGNRFCRNRRAPAAVRKHLQQKSLSHQHCAKEGFALSYPLSGHRELGVGYTNGKPLHPTKSPSAVKRGYQTRQTVSGGFVIG